MEYSIETLEQIANENVTGIETGLQYSNRVRITLENGYVIVADIVKVQTPEERLEQIEFELNDAKAKVTQLETIYSVLRDGTVSF